MIPFSLYMNLGNIFEVMIKSITNVFIIFFFSSLNLKLTKMELIQFCDETLHFSINVWLFYTPQNFDSYRPTYVF